MGQSRREFVKMLLAAGAAGMMRPSFVFAQTPSTGIVKNFVHVFLYGGADMRTLMPYISGDLADALKVARGNTYPTGILTHNRLSQNDRKNPIGFNKHLSSFLSTLNNTQCGMSIVTEYGVTGSSNFSHEYVQRQFQAGSQNDPSFTEKGWSARLFERASLVPTQVWGINETNPIYFNTEGEHPLVLTNIAQTELSSRYHEGMTCSFCPATNERGESITAAEDTALARSFIERLNAADLPQSGSEIEQSVLTGISQMSELALLAKSAGNSVTVDQNRFIANNAATANGFKTVLSDVAKVINYTNRSPNASAQLKASTKLIFTQYGGWDAHTNITGSYDYIIPALVNSLAGLISYLKEWNLLNETVILVHSEFGRTTRLNGSNGLDHAASNYAMILGGRVKNVVLGPEADLTEATTKNFLTSQVPFTSVLRTILSNAGFSPAVLNDVFSVRMNNESTLGIF